MKKQNNITYIIGAGASCGSKKAPSLPLVNQYSERFSELAKRLKDVDFTISPEKEKVRTNFLHHLKILENNSKPNSVYSTLDAYAKKLIKSTSREDKDSLRALKATMVTFFMFEQIYRPIDTRYMDFFNEIIPKNDSVKIELLNNVKVITWNYDIQFEKCFYEYESNNTLSSILEKFQTTFNYKGKSLNLGKFAIVRMNGIANGGRVKETDIFDFLDILPHTKLNQKIFDEILDHFDGVLTNKFKPVFNFAWEDTAEQKIAIQNAKKIASQTHILVVVGYSFPNDNMEIDSVLFSEMKQLKRIEVQTKEESRKETEQILKDYISNLNIKPNFRERITQFHKPIEMKGI